jgi:hypothetical protein
LKDLANPNLPVTTSKIVSGAVGGALKLPLHLSIHSGEL